MAERRMKGVVNYGLMVLNDYDDGSPDDRRYQSTVIVTGVARGGTSMVAQVLDRLGLFLGDTCDPVVFEDVEILRALQASDISKLAGIIANRNQRFPRWGFKVPNLHHLLPATETSRFRNARFVVVFRDPLAIARRNELSMHQSAAEALREAGENVAELTTYVAGIAAPVLLISYEKALWHADHMIDAICTFCGLTPINEQKAAALAAITPSGEAYIYSTQLVVLGQIDNICGTTLRGWCCFSGLTDAVEIEVIADGRPIGVHLAQDYRKDLLDAGIGLGCHAFHVDLTEVDIHPSTMISVRPSGRTVVLPNSGKSVDELRQHGRKITAVKIRLIMMLKNEGDLALSWITYHGSIVGYEKLIILDNGSTCDRTLSALKQGMAAGATVDYQYAAKADFTRRDQIYAALVQRMDSEDPADFYIA
jgi:hypothetical protein